MSLLYWKQMFQRIILNLIIIHGRLNISFTFLGFPKGDTYAHFLQIELAERVISFSTGTTIVFFFTCEPKGIFLILALQWKAITLITRLVGGWVVVVHDIENHVRTFKIDWYEVHV